MAAARQKEAHQALARFCSQVSGEAITEEQVKHFRFRDWRRFTQVGVWIAQHAPCCKSLLCQEATSYFCATRARAGVLVHDGLLPRQVAASRGGRGCECEHASVCRRTRIGWRSCLRWVRIWTSRRAQSSHRLWVQRCVLCCTIYMFCVLHMHGAILDSNHRTLWNQGIGIMTRNTIIFVGLCVYWRR